MNIILLKLRKFFLFIVILLIFSCSRKPEKSLIVYSGSGVSKPVKELACAFEKKYNIDVSVIDSGVMNLIEVIKETQKGDLFFYPSIDAKPFLPKVQTNIDLIGHEKIVMVVSKKNNNIKSFEDISKANVRILVGDFNETITGKVFEKIIDNSDKKNKIVKNVVFKVHASEEMMNLLLLNEADVAIIWKNILNLFKYNDFRAIEFPEKYNVDINVYISELSISKNKKNAQLFVEFTKKDGKDILKKWGFL